MCFYEQNVFSDCHCFKWGRFRQHCTKEYRIGETCGMKLIYEVMPKRGKCVICSRIDVATRKHSASKNKFGRWISEGKNPVWTENEQVNTQIYLNEIADLEEIKRAKLRSTDGQEMPPQDYEPSYHIGNGMATLDNAAKDNETEDTKSLEENLPLIETYTYLYKYRACKSAREPCIKVVDKAKNLCCKRCLVQTIKWVRKSDSFFTKRSKPAMDNGNGNTPPHSIDAVAIVETSMHTKNDTGISYLRDPILKSTVDSPYPGGRSLSGNDEELIPEKEKSQYTANVPLLGYRPSEPHAGENLIVANILSDVQYSDDPLDFSTDLEYWLGDRDISLQLGDNEPTQQSATSSFAEKYGPFQNGTAERDLNLVQEHRVSFMGFRNGLELDSEKVSTPKKGEQNYNSKEDDGTNEEKIEASPHTKWNIDTSRAKLRGINQKFWSAAIEGFGKLKAHAYSDTVTPASRQFYVMLGDVSNVVKTGLDAIENIMDGTIPRSLKEMYCFIHVAYAMSKSEAENLQESDPISFASGINIFRHCLSSDIRPDGQSSERDLFDEIVELMWDELRYGWSWIKQQNLNIHFPDFGFEDSETYQLTSILMSSCNTEEHNYAFCLDGKSSPTCDIPVLSSGDPIEDPKTPVTWENVVKGVIFSKIFRFLKSLEEIGAIFTYLCGTWSSAIQLFIMTSITNPKRSLAPRQLEVQDHIQDHFISPLRVKRFLGVNELCNAANYMLRTVSFVDLPTFEQYVLGLAKIHKRPMDEFLHVVRMILALAYSCNYSLPERCKGECNFEEWVEQSLESKIGDARLWHLMYEYEEIPSSIAFESAFEFKEQYSPDKQQTRSSSTEDTTSICSAYHDAEPILGLNAGPDVTDLFHSHIFNEAAFGVSEREIDNNGIQNIFNDFSIGGAPPGLSNFETADPKSIGQIYQITSSTLSDRSSFEAKPGTRQKPTGLTFITYDTPPRRKRASQRSERSSDSSSEQSQDAKSVACPKRRKIDENYKKYACNFPGCEHRATTKDNLKRHQRGAHSDESVKKRVVFCDVQGCSSQATGARALENMKTHKRHRHGAV